ncbi:MAG: Adenylate cyclase [Bacteroidota bacterium]|jgi:class 3 adenylate cyclase
MLAKLIRYFIPESYQDTPENVRKARLTVGTLLVVAYFNINYIVISLLISYKGCLYSQVPLLIVSLACLFLYKSRVSVSFVYFLFFVAAILSIAISVHFTLGYKSFILPWIASTPIVGMMLLGRRGSLAVLIACCLSLTYFYYHHLQGTAFTEDYNLKYKNVFSYSTHLGLIIILYLIALVFDNAKKTALNTLDQRNMQLQAEKVRSDELLHNILPEEVVGELRDKGEVQAKQYQNVSVLFTDFVNFTSITEHLDATALVAEINKYYRAFDAIIEKHGLEKIKTIGDAYLAVAGLPNEAPDHAEKAIQAAKEICTTVANFRKEGGLFELRVGINSGPIIAGVVGVKKFAYDIWGDTVNTASRMESASETGKINISVSTYNLVRDKISCTPRGKLEAKSKGLIDMYFVDHV